MRDLRIVFMGTPEFAVETLKTLINNNYNIVGVITAPDKPAGRGRRLKESAVKEYAVDKGIKVLQPVNLKDTSFIEELTSLQANLQVVVAFRMLPQIVWQMPQYGTFNLHASLLPDYRGAAPINWAIINGETKTGVTTFFIDEKIDTGEMILQKEVEINNNDTAGTLHDKLMNVGANLVLETVKLIEKDEAITKKQTETGYLKAANKIHKDTCKINWNNTSDIVYNFIRGLSPYPTAWSILYNNNEELNVKIYSTSKIVESHTLQPGQIVTTKNEMKVAVKDGFIFLTEIQLPGKRKMNITDVLNGYEFQKGAKML
ncbi:methionyl-tRNA formyltransferase [Abyssalbus ytuae]|uniref:Methionyl-tRNA formyltransferase n=1 Tax=Abyssalbus ytuae TaxID=2926907 RepID=A0A9E6ZS52_9FLAO|nr:methionyl-tRNA formyltransferase [Abyssalbus ytuae]UOB17838.1 methionyl-tRNA formyltransferase [Abyssalbus ytuae]